MLKNLKVIELASVLAGPMVGTFFAELGAEVIKIENKTTQGDVTRQWKLPTENQSNKSSAYYAAANFGKKSLFLDVKNKEDYNQVIALVKDADIVIANFKTGAAQKLQLDFDSIRKINPAIIYGEITGFGENEKRTAFDVVLQAETGFMSMNGEPTGKPVKMPVALIDILAAHQLKEGLLLALLNRTDEAQKVSVSLYDTAVASLANQATNWLIAKHIAQPMGTLHPNIAPYGELFLTKDEKWLVLAIGNDKQFAQLCNAIEQSELSDEDKFSINPNRVKNREELSEIIQKSIKTATGEYWSSLLSSKDIPYGIVNNMKEVFDDKKAQQLI
ncbi:MAG: CaiB/BaiF CoA transferase family protein [Chitinophagales bacterium]